MGEPLILFVFDFVLQINIPTFFQLYLQPRSLLDLSLPNLYLFLILDELFVSLFALNKILKVEELCVLTYPHSLLFS